MKKPLIIITGPTAVGKTSLSIALAKKLGGEIISADSMQVYRHMDIGSAKVTPQEMDGIPHHLIDILDPDQEFNVTVFQKRAKDALNDIVARDKVPIVAGGTGFYIQALLYDIDFTQMEDDGSLRRELEELARKEGADYIHGLLNQVDPESAKQIHANNQKRVIRAIEFFRLTGRRISDHNKEEREKESPYQFLYYVVNTNRDLLYGRIDRRVDEMMSQGLLSEVQKLRDMGFGRELVSMQGLGYKELLSFLDGEISLEEAVYIIKRDTRHFAKRQITWFKREREVRWLNLPEYGDDRERLLEIIMGDWSEMRDGNDGNR